MVLDYLENISVPIGIDLQVLKDTSNRMINKFQHPILEAINNIPSDYDSEASQQHYKTNYQDRFGPKPDHIKDK